MTFISPMPVSQNLLSPLPTLVVFCKKPELHQGKQRLVKNISAEKALTIAQALLACAIEDSENWPGPVVIACSDANDLLWTQSLLESAQAIPQLPHNGLNKSNNLGERLNYVDKTLRKLGHQELVFIGTDAPILNEVHYQSVISALNHHDIVLSAADDGGVTIMANKIPWPILAELPWSTDKLSSSLSCLCQQNNLNVNYILPSYDIDYTADLKKLLIDLQTDNRPKRKRLLKEIKQLTLDTGLKTHA